jgi:hypothetical protein
VACEDEGVKRQHEYILRAALADGGGGARRRLLPVRGARVPSPAAVFAVSLLAGVSLAADEPGLPFEGLLVTVVTPRQLYLMKKDTVRPKDRMDAEALRRKFGLPDD